MAMSFKNEKFSTALNLPEIKRVDIRVVGTPPVFAVSEEVLPFGIDLPVFNLHEVEAVSLLVVIGANLDVAEYVAQERTIQSAVGLTGMSEEYCRVLTLGLWPLDSQNNTVSSDNTGDSLPIPPDVHLLEDDRLTTVVTFHGPTGEKLGTLWYAFPYEGENYSRTEIDLWLRGAVLGKALAASKVVNDMVRVPEVGDSVICVVQGQEYAYEILNSGWRLHEDKVDNLNVKQLEVMINITSSTDEPVGRLKFSADYDGRDNYITSIDLWLKGGVLDKACQPTKEMVVDKMNRSPKAGDWFNCTISGREYVYELLNSGWFLHTVV